MHTCRLRKITLEELNSNRMEVILTWTCEQEDFAADRDSLDEVAEHVVKNQFVVR